MHASQAASETLLQVSFITLAVLIVMLPVDSLRFYTAHKARNKLLSRDTNQSDLQTSSYSQSTVAGGL